MTEEQYQFWLGFVCGGYVAVVCVLLCIIGLVFLRLKQRGK